MRCCKREPIITVRGNKFCKTHFVKFFEKQVIKVLNKALNELQKQQKQRQKEKLNFVVAVSGGKDSTTLAYVLAKLKMQLQCYDFDLVWVDLGFNKYAIDVLQQLLDKIKSNFNMALRLHIIKVSDYLGISLAELWNKRKLLNIRQPICSLCGMIKRYLLNHFAYTNNFDALLTGHNLDDELALALINLSNQNLEQFARSSFYIAGNPEFKLAAKLKPFYYVSEKEILTYASLHSVPFTTKLCEMLKSKQNTTQYKFKQIIEHAENLHAGFKYNIMKSFVKLRKFVKQSLTLKQCNICGYATTSQLCSFCKLKERIKKLK